MILKDHRLESNLNFLESALFLLCFIFNFAQLIIHFMRILWIFAFLGFGLLQAQVMHDMIPFKCEGYLLEKIGYPSKVVSDHNGNLTYVEYWQQGIAGRSATGYYIQNIFLSPKSKEFDETWFKPLAAPNTIYSFMDICKLNKSVAVLGKVPVDKKDEKTVIQFFSSTGKDLTPQQNCSNYDTYGAKSKEFEEYVTVAPDSSHVLWMGYNPKADAKKRRHFVSVFGNDGKKIWSQELSIPNIDKKYFVRQTLVDKRGHAYFLLSYDNWANELAQDTLHKPIIVKYDYKTKKYAEYQVNIPNAAIPIAYMFLSRNDQLLVTGAVWDGKDTGILNGEKLYGKALRWNQLFYKRFNVWEGMAVDQDLKLDIPEFLTTKFASKSANFYEFRFLEADGKLFWLMEEAFSMNDNKGTLFARDYTAVIAIDYSKGSVAWVNGFDKKQRDYTNDMLFSYFPVIIDKSLNCIFLSDKGAQGVIKNAGFNLETGEVLVGDVIKNDQANNYFFPARSTQIDKRYIVLFGTGTPNSNSYKFMRMKFFEQKKPQE